MRQRLFILFFLLPQVSFSQQSLTKEQINRLADAGKVYGYIKYFHPFLQYKDINWDSAFAASVNGIIAARNRDEYAAVMQRLLIDVHSGRIDAATKTLDAATVQRVGPGRAREALVDTFYEQGGVLFYDVHDPGGDQR